MKNEEQKLIPGSEWRLSAKENGNASGRFDVENKGIFDELVVDGWFHIEQMNHNSWWGRLGPIDFWVSIDERGEPIVALRGLDWAGKIEVDDQFMKDIKKYIQKK